jgi:hypothetical protein
MLHETHVRTYLLVTAILLTPVGIYYGLTFVPATKGLPQAASHGSGYNASVISFSKITVGPEPVGHPRVTNVQITRLNSGDQAGVIVCDAGRNAVLFYLESAPGSGEWKEQMIAQDVLAPAHATVVDIDADGDDDVVVSVLGNIEPDDGVIGRLLLMTYEAGTYQETILLDDVRRVADAQAGDLDQDGDLDLAVAVFGYNRGGVLWLENKGGLRFTDHELLSGPGVIHVPIADYDKDGDLDIAAGVTQDEEELWGIENLGGGKFRSRRLWFTHNFDLGSAGLLSSDIDRDGDIDLVLPAGDNLEDFDPFPQPYHGCYLFENEGGWKFTIKRIADLGGTYGAATGDIDADGDEDIALVSMANVWDEPDRASLVWLENDGKNGFHTWQIASNPTHLVTVAIGDLNGDSKNDILAGGLHIRGPFNRLGRVSAWLNQGKAQP